MTAQMPPVHRLTDMTVEEVSLVDKAANRRRFLVVKRDHSMSQGAPLTQTSNGHYTSGAAGAPVAADKAFPPAPPAAGPPAGAPPAPAAAPATPPAPSVSLTADAKGMLTQAIASAKAKILNAEKLVASASVAADEASASSDALLDMLIDSSDELEDAAAALAGVDLEDEEKAEPESEDTEKTAAPAGPSATSRFEVRQAKRVLAKAEVAQTSLTLVQKYGAKMSKARRERFSAAMKVLSDLMGELIPTTTAKVKAPFGGPPKGDDPAKVPPTKVPTTKADTSAEKAQIAALQKSVADLTELVRAQAADHARLSKGQASNAIPVAQPAKTASEHVWPLDINELPKLPNTFGGDPV